MGGFQRSKRGGNKKKSGSNQTPVKTSVPEDGVTCTCQVSRDSADESGTLCIELEHLCLSVSGRELLDDTSLSLQPGCRYGLLGANGAGKTSLLRQLATTGKLIPSHISSLLVEQEDVGDTRTALQTVMEADVKMSQLLQREALLTTADDSRELRDARVALALTNSQMKRTDAEKLGRLVDRTGAGRAGETRQKWIEAESEATQAEQTANGLLWLAAECAARDAANELEGKTGDSSAATANSKEGKAERRRRGPMSFISGAMMAPLALARRLQVEADLLGKLLDQRTKTELKEQEQKDMAYAQLHPDPDESSDAIWNELSEALIHVREEMADAGTSYEEAEGRAASILKGLGFSEDQAFVKATAELSGGWRMRVALARALFVKPALLMLDEPTNHLDLPAIVWLEQWLTEILDGESTIVVLVSHDRAFMDAVCTDMLKVSRQKIEEHLGMGFSEYVAAAAESAAAAGHEAANLEQRKKTMAKSIEAMVAKARESGDDKRLKQAAARRRKLELLEKRNAADSTPLMDPTIRLSLPCAEPLGYYGSVLQLEDVAVGWDSAAPPVVSDITLEIDLGSRIGILGRNGGGKSTLLAAVAGIAKPLKGKIHRHHNLRIGYFSQHSVEELLSSTLPSMSAVDLLVTKFRSKEADARAFLARFGLGGRLAVQPMGTLSGGQKVRLSLSLLFKDPPHILLLDEPTNHLDVQTVDALGDALENFDGGLVLVSHDRQLLCDACTEFYSVTKTGRLKTLDDGVAQYVKSVTKGISNAIK